MGTIIVKKTLSSPSSSLDGEQLKYSIFWREPRLKADAEVCIPSVFLVISCSEIFEFKWSNYALKLLKSAKILLEDINAASIFLLVQFYQVSILSLSGFSAAEEREELFFQIGLLNLLCFNVEVIQKNNNEVYHGCIKCLTIKTEHIISNSQAEGKDNLLKLSFPFKQTKNLKKLYQSACGLVDLTTSLNCI